jgi:hypothetical protein
MGSIKFKMAGNMTFTLRWWLDPRGEGFRRGLIGEVIDLYRRHVLYTSAATLEDLKLYAVRETARYLQKRGLKATTWEKPGWGPILEGTGGYGPKIKYPGATP